MRFNVFLMSLLLILVCVVKSVHSQEYSTYLGYPGKERINQYFVGKNPAFLKFSKKDELLGLSVGFNNSKGFFKGFLDPEQESKYLLSATGKKSIEENQYFKGSFNIVRHERQNWDWIFVREYDKNIFLLGDSTTGNSRFTGILLNSEYSLRIANNYLLGVNLDYLVDEGIKEVSPRPTSEYRYIDVTLGAGYDGIKGVSLGIKGNIIDKTEKIVYQEDEGALTTETIILKFRGYDYPNVFRKKSEVRYSYINQYLGQFDYTINAVENLLITGYVNSGAENSVVKDNSINPESDGYFQSKLVSAGLIGNYTITSSWNTGLSFEVLRNERWGKSSKYNVLYYEDSDECEKIQVSCEYILDRKTSFTIEIEGYLNRNDMSDYYSDISYANKSNLISGAIGVNHEISEGFRTAFIYQYSENRISAENVKSGQSSNYFSDYRIRDIYFRGTNYSTHKGKLIINLSKFPGGDLSLFAQYGIMIPQRNSHFSGKRRNELDMFLEYKINVF